MREAIVMRVVEDCAKRPRGTREDDLDRKMVDLLGEVGYAASMVSAESEPDRFGVTYQDACRQLIDGLVEIAKSAILLADSVEARLRPEPEA